MIGLLIRFSLIQRLMILSGSALIVAEYYKVCH
jgi:hypothetical protein